LWETSKLILILLLLSILRLLHLLLLVSKWWLSLLLLLMHLSKQISRWLLLLLAGEIHVHLPTHRHKRLIFDWLLLGWLSISKGVKAGVFVIGGMGVCRVHLV
jgi:hypothetical protein